MLPDDGHVRRDLPVGHAHVRKPARIDFPSRLRFDAPLRMRRSLFAAAALLAGIGVGMPALRPAHADILTRVFFNGVPVPVYFNDGDTFRIKDGPLTGIVARLEGFNTLESFGGVHQWGTWDPWELYANAKEATLNARRGTWHCIAPDMHTDGYGRVLAQCPDLAISDLRAGLAHVYSVNEEPGRYDYLRAQREAIAAHRGMWAHGVPEFIITSVHSADEDSARGQHYNRMISVVDGHTESWEHNESYHECQPVCAVDVVADSARIDAVAMQLRESAALRPVLADMDNLHLSEAVSMVARVGRLPTWATDAQRAQLGAALSVARDGGQLGELTHRRGACMTYVTFQRRYGEGRAACLRHGR